MYSWLLLLIIVVLIGMSIYMRIVNYRTSNITDTIETKNSPLSTAVRELIATAGGIYLSLIMLISFLKIEMPETARLCILTVDPIALTSIGLAIIQPFIIQIFLKNRR